jgi:colanic acid/amylovoran biosynthesis glycosyltransferase
MLRTESQLQEQKRNLAVVTPYVPSLTETFIRSHINQLPAKTTMIHGWRPSVGDTPILSWPKIVGFKLIRTLTGSSLNREMTAAYLEGFRRYKTEAVLAEYGECGVQVMGATTRANLPLIVHFHGYDASVSSVLDEHRETYPRMFSVASAVIAVSHAMRRKLIELGAPADIVHYNPYGVDCEGFGGARPGQAPPFFVAVGRFTEKKAPQITLRAFAKTVRAVPTARLRMVGEGPLLEECRQLAVDLAIEDSVVFLGAQDHKTVEAEMKQARCFVQHSIVAPSGDSEGTPVSILEAGATGLPVISTRHAGIPDVVSEGQTGFLVDEGDEDLMAKYMIQVAQDAELAGRIGSAARRHISTNFDRSQRLGKLWEIIESCIASN